MTTSPQPFSIAGLFRAGFFAFLPGAAVAGGLALAPLVGAAGLASVRPSALAGLARAPALWLLLAFLAWALASTAWSPYPDHSQAWRLGITVFPGLLFAAASPGRASVEAAGLAAILVLAGMLAVEAFMGMPFNRAVQPETTDWVLLRNPGRGVSVLMVVVWGVLGALIARGGWARMLLFVLVGVAGAVISAQFFMDANLIAFTLGAIAFALGFLAPRVAAIGVSGLLALWLLAAPFVTRAVIGTAPIAEALPDSWAIRGEIWRFATARIVEQPWIGRGMDASRAFPDEITVRDETMHALPLHPHSFSLQVWLETGAVGAGLGALALIFGGIAMARAFKGQRGAAAAAAATLAAAGFISNVSYGAWQEWWVAAILAAAALVAAVPRKIRNSSPRRT